MASDKNPPLSELLPGLMGVVPPAPATLEELAEGPPVPRKISRPAPINLPTYTFLRGDAQKCFDLAEALAKEDQTVYLEDLRLPIYDGLCTILGLGFAKELSDPRVWSEKHNTDTIGDLIEKMTLLLNLDYLALLYERTGDLLSTNAYRFVIRDTSFTGVFTPIEAHPDTVIVDANEETLESLRKRFG